MAGYENGTSTRRAILDACKKLFYEKGYHETSYDDICREAHVNRGSIYYHFKEKENIRYEVLWEASVALYHDAQKLCPQKEYQGILAVYLFWWELHLDSRSRKFNLDYMDDYPMYERNSPFAIYFDMLNKYMYRDVLVNPDLDNLGFAALYGLELCLMRLLDKYPEQYSVRKLFTKGFLAGNGIRRIPHEEIRRVWEDLQPWLDRADAEVERIFKPE